MDKIIETLEKLPCLRVLYIFNRVVSRIHGAQPLASFACSFPHLESLLLYAVESELRVEERAMPRLRKLYFSGCPNLIIPDRLKQVRATGMCVRHPLY
ncbi:hypothetical protein C1H46_028173 [Malus baccata]|uniref:FBD domain-containing protein n=1 Tax=Malus baccata TaxID=106549 RepID=A0A540LII9_MALBA|nr:hypothetical protein C1H46_028173 [Malus baccata]